MSSSFDVGRSSFAPLSGATARRVSACHAEAFDVGGLHLCFVFSKLDRMSLEQLETAIFGLRPEDRKRLAVWFEEHRQELLGEIDQELTEQQQTEILRRRDQALANPELLEPWDGTIERVRERLHEFRSQEASPR